MSVSRGSWRFEAIDEGSGPEAVADDGRLNLSTRRGKQFNSMVQEGNRLIRSERVSPEAGIPDYKARVEVSPAAAPASASGHASAGPSA
jgi:hypothetical protein